MKAHQDEFKVVSMCQLMKVSRSSYYNWLQAPKTDRQDENEALIEQIKRIFNIGRGTYGTRRIKRQLSVD